MLRARIFSGFIVMLMMFSLVGCLPKGDVDATPGVDGNNLPSETLPVINTIESLPTATQTPSSTPTATLTATPDFTPTNPPPTLTPTPTPVAVGPENFPENINPLTGLYLDDPEILVRPPVLVKVSNFPRSLRPHSGLSKADMVFEYWIGEGSTRFTALYYGQDAPRVGPVRSGRLIDASLGQVFQAILGYASADSYVYGRLLSTLGDKAITEGPSTCPALCRGGNEDVNSVFADTALLTEYYVKSRGVTPVKPVLDGFRFESVAPDGGQTGSWLQVMYSLFTRSEWRFDGESGKYLRWIEEVDAAQNVTMVELIDRETGEQLAFDNVLVMFVQHNELKPTLHEMVFIGNTTGQRALLFRDGQVYELTWKSAGYNLPFRFYYADGTPAAFRPGNTWFEVVGTYSAVEAIADGEWQVRFYLP